MFVLRMCAYLQLKEDTRKASAYNQIGSFALNIPILKDVLASNEYQHWIKAVVKKKDDTLISSQASVVSWCVL